MVDYVENFNIWPTKFSQWALSPMAPKVDVPEPPLIVYGYKTHV